MVNDKYSAGSLCAPVRTKRRAVSQMYSRAYECRKRLVAKYRAACRAEADGEDPLSKLLENDFYLIEKQLAVLLGGMEDIKSQSLPVFASGENRGMPRVCAAAEDYVRASGLVCSGENAREHFLALQGCVRLTYDELCLLDRAIKLSLVRAIDSSLEKDAGREAELAVRNAVLSLERLDNVRWNRLIIELSPAANELEKNNGFNALDEKSAEYCLQMVKRIAKSLNCDELKVASAAVSLAAKGSGMKAEVGYFLAGEGEIPLRMRLSPDRPRLPMKKGPRAFIYSAAIISFAALLALALLKFGAPAALLAGFPALTVSISVVSRVAASFSRPRFVLRREPSQKDISGTAVAMPVLLTSAKDVGAALDRLLTHYLANPLEGVTFILLGDLKDADSPVLDSDAEVISAAEKGVARLNDIYGERFMLLLRSRKQRKDGSFGGYERKRGAVMQLCGLLLGKEDAFSTRFPMRDVRAELLTVLDSDTVLPAGTLKKLIGAASAAVNEPVIEQGGIKSGYSVFVPNIRSTARSSARSRFARLFGGDSGAELYSAYVSNLHMDLFSSGDFGGKGIVRVKPFYELLRGAIPEDTVLSHDLLEGSITGAAFLNDVTLYDEQPHNIVKWWKRQERWIRGDWQLLPFIFGKYRSSLRGALPRLKMLGNIILSLREPVTLALIFVSVWAGMPALLCAALAGFLFEPIKCLAVTAAASLRRKQHLRPLIGLSLRSIAELLALPFAAACAASAICKACWRMLVSKKNMLQWQTNAGGGDGTLRAVNSAAAALLTVGSIVFSHCAGITAAAALVLSAAWLTAPRVFRTIGREARSASLPGSEQKQKLIPLFAGAWGFFRDHCDSGTSFIPPDNIQEYPKKPAVMRTSPTNIGMALLAPICAFDAGFIDRNELVRRVGGTVQTLERMPKWNGNLYNWYDIDSLEPLSPLFVSSVDSGNLTASLMAAAKALEEVGAEHTAMLCRRLIEDTRLELLYDAEAELFRIGFDAENGCYTPAHYDLYASEARITSFAAIALGKVPVRHWRRLSRLMRHAPGGRVLLSWSGTAFEYLMPLIFFDTIQGSLQHEICLSAVRTQILSAGPGELWGVSECGWPAFDEAMYYRYRAFGTPALALEKTRSRPDITAPYAAALALYSEPEFASDLLSLYAELGCVGEYGLYEAVQKQQDSLAVVKSFMAHHKGMELCAYASALTDGGIAKRFMSLPEVRAHAELLFEEMPIKPIVIREYEKSVSGAKKFKGSRRDTARRIGAEADRGKLTVDGQLMSNGRYGVHIFSDGSSKSYLISNLGPIGMTCGSGAEILFRSGDRVWSCGSEAEFYPHEARLFGSSGGVRASVSVCAAANVGAELRRVRLVNTGEAEAAVGIGVFFRPMLARPREFKAHPAFLKLRTEAFCGADHVLFHLRNGSADEADGAYKEGLWQYAAVFGEGGMRFGTDGYTLPGRLRTPGEAMRSRAQAVFKTKPIEPYFSAVTEVAVKPREAYEFTFVLGAEATREAALGSLDMLKASYGTQTSLAAAVTDGLMRECGISPEAASESEPLAARIALEIPFRPKDGCCCAAENGKQSLWPLGVSGDLPILLVEDADGNERSHITGLKKLLAFAAYSRARGLIFDTVIVCRRPFTYGEKLWQVFGETGEAAGVRFIHQDAAGEEMLNALRAAALIRCTPDSVPYEPFRIERKQTDGLLCAEEPPMPAAAEYNGLGGFDDAMREYVFRVGAKATPAPWCNVLSNRLFGTVLTETGGGFTWFKNSRLLRLTPWENDPIADPVHERVTLYEGGKGFPLTPRGGSPGLAAHGFGYTRFKSSLGGIQTELTVFTDADLPVKYFICRVKNAGFEKKSLRLRLDIDWLTGEDGNAYTVRKRKENGVLIVSDPLCCYGGVEAFAVGSEADESGVSHCFSADEGQTVTRVFALGAKQFGEPKLSAHELTEPDCAEAALQKVKRLWAKRLSVLTCRTKDPDIDRLVNGILLYQTYSSRLFAKTGFYQNGGACGFRDCLQDASALLAADPETAKRIILEAASHQFAAGDVLHWWHDNGAGVRTRITDDRLFLPFTVMEYAKVTGDSTIWKEHAPYLKDVPIPEGKKDLYARFEPVESGSLLGHCIRAVDASLVFGAHGLPLMGGGDWNDGMDNVGSGGGESCFTGWMLVYVLGGMEKVCRAERLDKKADEYRSVRQRLLESLEENTWEEDRYLRAFYADGTPLGSKRSPSCAIDAVAQCWAVFCGAKNGEKAFDTMLRLLWDEPAGLLRLIDPPFSGGGAHRAGYIEDYVEGVRENGGQYTHAAVWALIAACALNKGDIAQRLFNTIDPIRKGGRDNIDTYRAEPYVLAGDVYSGRENGGRAGWSWYTGSAAWLYRALTEHVLGFKKRGDRLYIEPVNDLSGFTLRYAYRGSVYTVQAVRTGKRSITIDGQAVPFIPLQNDGKEHLAYVTY